MQIGDFKVRLEQKVHGSYDSIGDVEGLISEAARNLLLMIDPLSTKRVAQIEDAIYDDITSYALPADLKGDKILDIRPQANRKTSDVINATYQKDFDVWKDTDSMAIEMNSGVKTLRLNKALTPGILLEDSTLTTDWTTGGNATNVSVDVLNKITGNNSIKFDISAGGTEATMAISVDAQDLTTMENDGAVFLWAYIPSTTIITGVSLRWGSSATDYWTNTVTAAHDGTAFRVGWNLLRFDWASATEVGTPDVENVDYLLTTFTYDGTAVTSCRIDSVTARLGSIYELVYYSKYLFKSDAGTWKEEPTDDSDYINLDLEELNLLLYETCYLVGQEFGGEDTRFDTDFWENKRNEAWNKYMRTYKSERRKPQTKYYRM
jgi:hypothetical protein